MSIYRIRQVRPRIYWVESLAKFNGEDKWDELECFNCLEEAREYKEFVEQYPNGKIIK